MATLDHAFDAPRQHVLGDLRLRLAVDPARDEAREVGADLRRHGERESRGFVLVSRAAGHNGAAI